jgi:hypothetical protein
MEQFGGAPGLCVMPTVKVISVVCGVTVTINPFSAITCPPMIGTLCELN